MPIFCQLNLEFSKEICKWLKGHFWSVAKAALRIWCGTWNSNLESYLTCRKYKWQKVSLELLFYARTYFCAKITYIHVTYDEAEMYLWLIFHLLTRFSISMYIIDQSTRKTLPTHPLNNSNRHFRKKTALYFYKHSGPQAVKKYCTYFPSQNLTGID